MKRNISDLSSPIQGSKRLHRDEPGSSRLQSPVPHSSQPLTESSLPISVMTEKSLGDRSASEKGRWREYEDEPDGFFEHLDLPPDSKDYMRDRFLLYAKAHGNDFKSFLVFTAPSDLIVIQNIVERAGKGKSIQWSQLDLSMSLEKTDASCDDLIFCWLEAMKINCVVTAKHADRYEQLFNFLLPIPVKSMKEMSDSVASAFHRKEKPTSDGRLASEEIYRKIVQYYSAYPYGGYLAPYTSVVGPSGIGKSFMISQMAHGYGVYVVYSNFAKRGMLPYPQRSPIAEILPQDETRAVQTSFWESYLMLAMCDVELCRRIGISPSGFYYLQTMDAYRDYQKYFSERVFSFFVSYRRIGKSDQKRGAKLAQMLYANVEASEKNLESWREHLEKANHNPMVTAATGKDVPNALICLDEARTLLDGEMSLLFRSFRDAIRNRFVQTSKMGNLNLTKPQGDFFALLLDTTSRVANFSPPVTSDHSQKVSWGAGGQLFRPLFAIDTIDIFAKDLEKIHPDGSEEATTVLFHYGRPLWGALFASGQSLPEIMELAKRKVKGRGTSFLTALLSYRLSFYITNNAIAEDLVSGWLRYILYINEGRDMLLTSQPSEPILVHTSAVMMSDPVTRLQVLQQFARINFEGSINTGDLGECVAAIILFLTYDEVLYNETQGFPAAIPFKNFLASLLGGQVADEIMTCSSTDAEMRPICFDGEVFCNHFFKQEDDLSEKTIENAFLHGAGIILPDSFPGADLLIPIKLPSGKMTFFCIQVKNRARDSYSGSLRDETIRSFSKAAKALEPDMPFIGLTMALRCEHDASENQSVGLVHPPKSTKPSTRGTPSTSAEYNWTTKNKRILLLAVGLDKTVYPGITRCKGETSLESEAVLPLLNRLLRCKPGVTLPDDADLVYANRVRSLDV